MRTKHLTLREPTTKDAPFILELVNSAGWLKFIGDRGIHNLEAAQGYIAQIRKDHKTHGFGLLVMQKTENRRALGLCGLLQRDYLEAPDLGFAILPEFGRHGYTFEAATRILESEIKKGKYRNIFGITLSGNNPSQALLRKLGFEGGTPIFDPKTGDKNLLYTKKLTADHESQTIDNIL